MAGPLVGPGAALHGTPPDHRTGRGARHPPAGGSGRPARAGRSTAGRQAAPCRARPTGPRRDPHPAHRALRAGVAPPADPPDPRRLRGQPVLRSGDRAHAADPRGSDPRRGRTPAARRRATGHRRAHRRTGAARAAGARRGGRLRRCDPRTAGGRARRRRGRRAWTRPRRRDSCCSTARPSGSPTRCCDPRSPPGSPSRSAAGCTPGSPGWSPTPTRGPFIWPPRPSARMRSSPGRLQQAALPRVTRGVHRTSPPAGGKGRDADPAGRGGGARAPAHSDRGLPLPGRGHGRPHARAQRADRRAAARGESGRGAAVARVRADGAERDVEAAELARAALAEAQGSGLRAAAERILAHALVLVGAVGSAHRHAAAALMNARTTGDPGLDRRGRGHARLGGVLVRRRGEPRPARRRGGAPHLERLRTAGGHPGASRVSC